MEIIDLTSEEKEADEKFLASLICVGNAPGNVQIVHAGAASAAAAPADQATNTFEIFLSEEEAKSSCKRKLEDDNNVIAHSSSSSSTPSRKLSKK
jgi:hypothetical protein